MEETAVQKAVATLFSVIKESLGAVVLTSRFRQLLHDFVRRCTSAGYPDSYPRVCGDLIKECERC